MIPRLETQRLVLRAPRAEDHANSAAMWADPDVARHTVGHPSTPHESWVRLLRNAGLWSVMGFGYWVAELADGAFIGEFGLAAFRRPLVPDHGDAPEAGWVMAPTHHGKGYATEAMQAVLAWADAELAAPFTFCVIAPENAASIRVARALGYGAEVLGSSRGAPALVFTRARP